MAVIQDIMIEDKLTQLALKAGSGDESAMNELLPIVMSKAKAIAVKQLWHHTVEDVEDLAQDILYRFLKSLSSFKGKAKFNSWFSRLALNTCVSNHRKTIAKRRQSVVIDKPIYSIPKYDDTIYCQHLIGLCTEQQQPIMKLMLEGYDYQQIADKQDIHYEAVRSLYRGGINTIQLRHHGCSTNT